MNAKRLEFTFKGAGAFLRQWQQNMIGQSERDLTLPLFDVQQQPLTANRVAKKPFFLEKYRFEDTEHFLLLCPSFDVQRQDLLAGIAELLRPVVQIADLSNNALTQLLLYGDNDLSNNVNRSILELTLRFIHETGRFD